jgi:enterochelin esterase family protein
LPDAPDEPWIREVPGVPKGRVAKEEIRSSVLGEVRTFSVYVPADYDPNGAACALLVVFDGESYGRDAAVPTPTILDNLIYRVKIPATLAVLVDSGKTRDRDLLCSEPFEAFLATELVPWIRTKYRVTRDPSCTIVAGSSYGGLSAACTALRHPDVFGNVLSQSGSFNFVPAGSGSQDSEYYFESGWLTRQYVTAPKLPLRFYLQVGRFEGLSVENRHLRDVLEAKGYPVTFAEYSGNHDYLSWRHSLGEGLIALIGERRFQGSGAP